MFWTWQLAETFWQRFVRCARFHSLTSSNTKTDDNDGHLKQTIDIKAQEMNRWMYIYSGDTCRREGTCGSGNACTVCASLRWWRNRPTSGTWNERHHSCSAGKTSTHQISNRQCSTIHTVGQKVKPFWNFSFLSYYTHYILQLLFSHAPFHKMTSSFVVLRLFICEYIVVSSRWLD